MQVADFSKLLALCTAIMHSRKLFIFNVFVSNCDFYKLKTSVSFCVVLLLISTACIQRQRRPITSRETPQQTALNLNSASLKELEKLPGVGEKLAGDIIEYRRQNKRFRRPEELLLIRGISEKKYKAIRPLVVTK